MYYLLIIKNKVKEKTRNKMLLKNTESKDIEKPGLCFVVVFTASKLTWRSAKKNWILLVSWNRVFWEKETRSFMDLPILYSHTRYSCSWLQDKGSPVFCITSYHVIMLWSSHGFIQDHPACEYQCPRSMQFTKQRAEGKA